MNVFKAVRKRLSLSMSGGAGATSGNAQEAHLVSKSMEDLRLAPYEENDGNDMVFYCKLLGSEYVQDKNGSELARFAERVIQSYTGKEGAGLGTGSAINDESGGAAASAANSKRVLGKNKTMIRVNSDGLELSTDGSTEKNRQVFYCDRIEIWKYLNTTSIRSLFQVDHLSSFFAIGR